MGELEILYEDNHLLVINKPVGIATMGVEEGPTVHSLAADYLKRAYNKPGKAFVGIVSRIDTMTSGVMVLARTSKAASRLSAQFADRSGGSVDKIYLAGLEGCLSDPAGEMVDHVVKDDRAHRMRVADPMHGQSKEARLLYCRLAADERTSMVAVRLLTGRKHQIRVQFASRGYPVLGDRKYGSQVRFPSGIALHSWRLRISHPTLRTPMWFRADPPSSWDRLLRNVTLNRSVERDVEHRLQIDGG